MELIFEVRDAEEGGYCAQRLGTHLYRGGDVGRTPRQCTGATSLHFEDGPVHPRLVQLHYVKDELIPVEAA